MLNENEKKIDIKLFVTFFIAILLMTFILIAFSFIAKKSYNDKLKIQVSELLQKKYPEQFENNLKVGDNVQIKSAIAVSSNMYKLMSNNSFTNKYIIITRITTYYGPQTAVFSINEYEDVFFEGFVCLNSRIKKQLENSQTDISIKYWKNQIKKIYHETIYKRGIDE